MEDIELKLVATALRTGGNSSEIHEKCGAFSCCLTYLGMHDFLTLIPAPFLAVALVGRRV